MLKIKDIINVLKNLYKSNLLIESRIDVILTMGVFSLICNFLSKFGLVFVVASGILSLLDVTKGVCLLILFTPSILVFSNVPIVYTKNFIHHIKECKTERRNIKDINYEKNNFVNTEKRSFNNDYVPYKKNNNSKELVRVRKK